METKRNSAAKNAGDVQPHDHKSAPFPGVQFSQPSINILFYGDMDQTSEEIHTILLSSGRVCQFDVVISYDELKNRLDSENYDLLIMILREGELLPDTVADVILATQSNTPIIFIDRGETNLTSIESLLTGMVEFVPLGNSRALMQAVARIIREHEARDWREVLEGDLAYQRETVDCLFGIMPGIIIELDETGHIVRYNSRLEELTGHKLKEVRGRRWLEIFCEQSGKNGKAAAFGKGSLNLMPATGELSSIRAGDGREIVVEWQTSFLRYPSGGIRGLIAAGMQTSDRRSAEDERRTAEARYRSIAQNAACGICHITPDGRISAANHALASMLGYDSEDELAAVEPAMLYGNTSDRDRFRKLEREQGKFENVHVEWRQKNGNLLKISLSGQAMEDSAGHFEGYEVIAEDITQRQAIADQYHHAQKMEAVGLLAGGIAHDFNNLLTAVLGYAELLEAELQDEQLSMAQEIRKAATCASALTRQLLAFSRRQMYKPKLLDLNVIVADNVKMLSRMIGENIQLVTRLGAHASHFIADQAQMEQVLMNLAVNARDAMPDGGPLSIETETVHVDKIQDKSRTHQAPPGEYVMLSVGDTGCGIGSEVLPNIFEPFFTTKEEGKGTGLGLSTVYGIVRQSGGHIYVDSEVGVGTTFKIYLPSVREDPTERNTDDRRTIQARGSESILVVEDEGFIRRVVIRTLTEAGYTVCEACDGPDAISRAQDMPRLHLLIADMIMPGMGGREVAEKIRNLHPQTKVLFISGYTDDAIPHQGIFETGLAFLEKPFTPSGLSQAVREILDS